MTITVYAIEGLDRLGKSTLIEGIRNWLGYFEVIHFSKPQKLDIYEGLSESPFGFDGVTDKNKAQFFYQAESFRNSMLLAKSGARIIFDRWHLGEVVYSPMYRGYSGDYVFAQELISKMSEANNVRLILLTEDFDRSQHFVDDGESLGSHTKRAEEQERFITAFERSAIMNKKIICVTDPITGKFRSRESILQEALT